MWAPFVFGFQEAGDCAGRRGRWGWDSFGDWGWSTSRTAALARPRRAAVRAGRPQVRHPAAARGEAAPRLRDHQGAREPLRRVVRAKSGHRLPHTDHARGPRLRARRARGGRKKIYEITDEGQKHLAEHSTTVNDIFDRIARFVAGFTDSPMMELNAVVPESG